MILHNSADNEGGGIRVGQLESSGLLGGASSSSPCSVNIEQSTFLGNTAQSGSQVCSCERPTHDFSIKDCIIWGHDTGFAPIVIANTNTLIIISNSIVQYGYTGVGATDIIMSNPYLRNDGHISKTNSSARGASKITKSLRDVDGELFGIDGAPDIGADEYIDSDSDKLPDWWENQYNMDIYNSQDATNDVDNDGVSAQQEYDGETNPTTSIDENGDGIPDDYFAYFTSIDTDGDGMEDYYDHNPEHFETFVLVTNFVSLPSHEGSFSSGTGERVLARQWLPYDPQLPTNVVKIHSLRLSGSVDDDFSVNDSIFCGSMGAESFSNLDVTAPLIDKKNGTFSLKLYDHIEQGHNPNSVSIQGTAEYVGYCTIKVELVNAWETDAVCNRVPNPKQNTDDRLFVATEASGQAEITVKSSIQPVGIEDKILCAIYDGSTHLVSDSFSSACEAELNFTPTGPANNYLIKVGYDANGNNMLESSEFYTTVTNFDVTAFTSTRYNDEVTYLESKAQWADMGGYNVGATLLFRFLNDATRPCPFDSNNLIATNCFTLSSLTHNVGEEFSSSGAGNIDEHIWNASSEPGYKVANSEEAEATVNAILDTHRAEVINYFLNNPSATSYSASWHHTDVGTNFDEENYFPMDEYDLHVAFGHATFLSIIVAISVEKDSAGSLEISNLVLTGTLIDLYDFNYEEGGLNSRGATIQIGWDTSITGRDAGNIFFDRVHFQETFAAWNYTF